MRGAESGKMGCAGQEVGEDVILLIGSGILIEIDAEGVIW